MFTLSNEGTSTAHDAGSSPSPTFITGGTYSFVTDPVCYGATHALQTTSDADANVPGAIIQGRRDINDASSTGDTSTFDYNSGSRTIIIWCNQLEIWNPTVIYEQGGFINNFAIMGGGQTSFQAADAGHDLLVVTGKSLGQANRSKFFAAVWEHYTQHSGQGNRVLFYENGVQQGIAEGINTDPFPLHNGNVCVGNTNDSLKSFNESTQVSQTVAKRCNFLGFYNNVSLNETQIRGIFERMVLPEVLIDSDTVSNQQAALDALSGTVYQDVNCAIEIRQATDATDYTLTLDNIQFVQNPNLRDIAVKYVGPNTLTLVNVNGSNAVEVCAPAEQDLDGTTVLSGGGSVVISNPATLTITGVIPNAEVRIYEYNGTEDYGTELAGIEDNPGNSFVFNHSLGGQQVLVQHIATAEGYEEIELVLTLLSTNQNINLEPNLETNI